MLCKEFYMIKYARNGNSIPHERIFKLNANGKCILWKPSRPTRYYSERCCLQLRDTIEVRCGQQTRNFSLFPYTEVDNQSFSLIFQKASGEWCGIGSLDLICDSVIAFEQWKSGLKDLIYYDQINVPYHISYKTEDPFFSHLKNSWCLHTDDDILSADVAIHILRQYHKNVKRSYIKSLFKNVSKKSYSGNLINWESFIFVFNMLQEHSPLHAYYKSYAEAYPQLGMTADEFHIFLINVQGVRELNIEDVKQLMQDHDKENDLYKRYITGNNKQTYKTISDMLSFYGFVSFVRSSNNSIIKVPLQDMSQPLSHYFINSSHNTYLTGHQLKGISSCEAYVYALHKGCRSLEIDCWDGQEEPIVTHGMTLTSKIPLRHVLEVIKAYAFDKSPYPIILSLENHCSGEQQKIMADMFVSIFGDMLATSNLSQNNTLPSPDQLKNKIILKGNPKGQKKQSRVKIAPRKLSELSKQTCQKFRSKSDSVVPQTTQTTLSAASSEPDLLSFESPSASYESNNANEEQAQVLLEDSVSQLIVYCRTIPYKRNYASVNCCEMYSFSESMVTVLANKYPKDIIGMSENKFLRVYPKATRVDSSNFNPIQMWSMGVQMVAMNVQKPDAGLHINNGFFQKSTTGYILKPDCFLNEGRMSQNPKTNLKMKILCGQFVASSEFGGLPIAVEIELIGMNNDSNVFITETCQDVIFPVWKNNSVNFLVSFPAMSVVYWKVFAVGRTSKLVYQKCLPLDCIQSGLRYVPMATPTDMIREENGLFVFIEFTCAIKSTELEQLSRPRSRVFTL